MRKMYHVFLFIIQYCFYYLITPLAYCIYKNKYPWIISERGDDARDNGYTMFKYLRQEQPYINAYFLIKNSSVDKLKVKSLGKVVRYKSLKHWLLYRFAECRMSTHLSAFSPGNYIGEWFKHHKQYGLNVFLQHGITHNEFPSNYYEHNGSTLFICGAQPEYEHILTKCHYPKNHVAYTGFSRFDNLHDFKTKNQILVMPTWRSFLQGLTKREFKDSAYFKAWDGLLKNHELNEKLEREGVQLLFYLHYSLQNFSDCFTGYRKNITIADFDHYDVQTLLKESKLLITDYSSIAFDFAYMRKPLIYYQFDYEEFYSKHYKHSYFSHDKDGFGPVIKTQNELVDYILTRNNILHHNDDKYTKNRDAFFSLYDTNNSKRIFNSIINSYIENNHHKTKRSNITYLIFTGDDYGRNKESSSGINEAFKNNFIQQASFMVNRTQEEQSFCNTIPKQNIVYHFNITEGYQSFDDTTFYAYSVNKKTSVSVKINNLSSFLKISKSITNIIKKELDYQIVKYKKLGFSCGAFDSHGHVHNKIPIAKILIQRCKEAGFKVVRIPSNVRRSCNLFHKLYKIHVIHMYRRKFLTADYFCSCYDLIHMRLDKYKNKTIEIMTHPFMVEGNLVNRRDVDFTSLKKYIEQYNVKLISYNELIKIKGDGCNFNETDI